MRHLACAVPVVNQVPQSASFPQDPLSRAFITCHVWDYLHITVLHAVIDPNHSMMQLRGRILLQEHDLGSLAVLWSAPRDPGTML